MAGREGSSTMLRAVAEVLRRRGTAGWLVGGSVRDRELGRFSPDVDVAVMDEAAAVAREIAAALGSPWFALSERHPAYRVLGPDGYVDVAAVRGGGILADLALRDFTVNAMAEPLEGGVLLDPVRGSGSPAGRRLVAVSDHVFADDPLRLMRAPRFCHVLGLRLDELAGGVDQGAGGGRCPARRRSAWLTEMALTLAAGRAAEAVRLWHDLGLLSAVLPEFPVRERLEPTLALLELAGRLPGTSGGLVPGGGRHAGGAAGAGHGRRHEPAGRPPAGRVDARAPGRGRRAAARRLRLSGAMLSLLTVAARSRRPRKPARELGLGTVGGTAAGARVEEGGRAVSLGQQPRGSRR